MEVLEFLRARTPVSWLEMAVQRQGDLLLDHANCEKKAASTALSLMFTYPENTSLAASLSRLAREELRHFEQVQRMMASLAVPFRRLSPARYAQKLRQEVGAEEPERQVDLLITGAFIEARSCERFLSLAPILEAPLSTFYATLRDAEARHHLLYLELATRSAQAAGMTDVEARIARFAEIEAELITSPDPQFRFHSGTPATNQISQPSA
jgi:tRNA-(ms[2]io[6]A)-hydroxylase